MDVELNGHEARVLGVLIEKGLATPDHYPLSLNAVTSGCNQKSNRDPVTDFSAAEVTVALTGLQFKHLAGVSSPAGRGVDKYRHSAAEHLGIGERDLAVLAELLLRGPQTAGELRQRASRMRPIPDREALQAVLARLIERGLARRLPPSPGSRAERYAQCLCTEGDETIAPPSPPRAAALGEGAGGPPSPCPPSSESRLAALEQEVAALRAALTGLAEKLGEKLDLPGVPPER